VFDEVQPGRLGQADDGGLRGAVDRHQSFTAPAGLRGHVDDLATPPARDHALGRRLEGEEEALDVDGEDPVVAGFGHFDDRAHVEDRCVVDENVDAAPALNDALDRSLDRRSLGDIERDREAVVAVAAGGFPRVANEISATAARAPSAI
jgi:hypothetical protein